MKRWQIVKQSQERQTELEAGLQKQRRQWVVIKSEDAENPEFGLGDFTRDIDDRPTAVLFSRDGKERRVDVGDTSVMKGERVDMSSVICGSTWNHGRQRHERIT